MSERAPSGRMWAEIRRRNREEREAQGLPAKIRDPEVLALAVRLLGLDRAPARRTKGKAPP